MKNSKELNELELRAELAGIVHEICVKEGEKVLKGQTVIILESMKMQIPFETPIDGLVEKVFVQEGDFVNEEDILLTIR